MPTQKRLKVLLSAYACEPDRGSEPGVGWEWATRMAKFHDTTVLTRSNNKEVIEKRIALHHVIQAPQFVYLDLPDWCIKLKRRGIIAVFLYYLLWQWYASRHIQKTNTSYDIIHHITFNGFRFPGAWWRIEAPVVLGPLGGGSITSSQYRKCYGHKWMLEKIREFSIKHWHWNPWTIASMRRARRVFVVGSDLQKRFLNAGIDAQKMLETALPLELENTQLIANRDQRKDFVWVGNLEPWKAWQIALEAFAIAASKTSDTCRLHIIGDGSQADSAKKYAKKLGIEERLSFLKKLPRNNVWGMMASSRALIFSSVRDTSGNVVLEAMGLECPVICFNHQGAAMMTDDQCAFRITPSDWNTSINDFANAIVSLANDDNIVHNMGKSGRKRVMTHFTWDEKIDRMVKIYEDLIERKSA